MSHEILLLCNSGFHVVKMMNSLLKINLGYMPGLPVSGLTQDADSIVLDEHVIADARHYIKALQDAAVDVSADSSLSRFREALVREMQCYEALRTRMRKE